MNKNRTVHEAAFRLSYDLSLQIGPKVGKLGLNLAPLQIRALRLIWSTENATMMDLSKTLKRDKGQITRLVDELCKSELVKRVPNPNDGRSKLLTLTKKSADFFKTVEKIEETFSEQLVDGIDPADLAVFFAVSDKLSANLKEISDEDS